MAQTKKPCKWCSSHTHYQSFCPRRPKKPIKPGKRTKLWQKTTKELVIEYPPDHAGYWYCYYCKIALDRYELTWEHLDGRDGDMITDRDKIVPCCIMDNSRKGSRSYESYCKEFYPHLLKGDM